MHAVLQVTEESLATFFADCGTVMDCRICGDPNSAMRFAFIEFMEESGAQEVGSAQGLGGLGLMGGLGLNAHRLQQAWFEFGG